MGTIAEFISRVRRSTKSKNMDSFVTDREIFSAGLKYAKALIKRMDNEGKLMVINDLFVTMPFVKLKTVSKVEAGCANINFACTIKRSVAKIPPLMQGAYGAAIRSVSSIDGSEVLYATTPLAYQAMANSTTFKYNKNAYYWIKNEYIYVPNREWEAVSMDVLPENTMDIYLCDEEDVMCEDPREGKFPAPDFLLAELEIAVVQEFIGSMNVPSDGAHDNQNINR